MAAAAELRKIQSLTEIPRIPCGLSDKISENWRLRGGLMTTLVCHTHMG
jgi:hypothetical protein